MSKINVFDRTLKIIARNYADLWLRLAFPGLSVRLVGALENVELALPTRLVDFVHRIEYKGQEYILHVEFQLEHEADLPRRMCIYYGALTGQFRLPIITLVLYLKPRETPVPDEYVVRLGDLVTNRFSYLAIKLWDYVDEIQSGRYRELAPLLLMLVRDPDERILSQERELIRAETDAQKRADLLAAAVAIGSRYFDKAFLRRFFREELEQMREATFIEEWIEEGIEEGIRKGIEQGLQQGLQQGRLEGAQQVQRENIVQILQARFKPSAELLELLTWQLRGIEDLSVLKELVQHALLDVTVTDFRTCLENMVTQTPS